jgi:hypothetical protein
MMGTTLACSLFSAAAAFTQTLPSPDTIKIVQEREARERALAERIAYQVAKQPKPAAVPEAPRRHLSPEEMRELMEALSRYFQENGGRVPIFWEPPQQR